MKLELPLSLTLSLYLALCLPSHSCLDGEGWGMSETLGHSCCWSATSSCPTRALALAWVPALFWSSLSPCTDHWFEYLFPYITSANDDQNAHNDAFGIWQMSWDSGMSEEHSCTSLSCAHLKKKKKERKQRFDLTSNHVSRTTLRWYFPKLCKTFPLKKSP